MTRPAALRLLVVGGVTVDTIHLPGRPAPFNAPGGAGLYTALGAQAADGQVTLFAQRSDPLHPILTPLEPLLDWRGPVVLLEEMPLLEIAHYGGGRAELLSAKWGALLHLELADLPAGLVKGKLCHIAALGPTAKQLQFARACREMGAAAVSAGTFGRAAYGETAQVRHLLSEVDFFFMNENESVGLFGSPEAVAARAGQVIFVTLGSRGALAVTPETRVFREAPMVNEVNPTGAGDTFCGAALAVLARGGTVEAALETGVRLASEAVGEQAGGS